MGVSTLKTGRSWNSWKCKFKINLGEERTDGDEDSGEGVDKAKIETSSSCGMLGYHSL
jgi:hypothetical protein